MIVLLIMSQIITRQIEGETTTALYVAVTIVGYHVVVITIGGHVVAMTVVGVMIKNLQEV